MERVEITPEEQWKITCHEAGHAIMGDYHSISMMDAIRGEGEVGDGPIDCPDGGWTQLELSQ